MKRGKLFLVALAAAFASMFSYHDKQAFFYLPRVDRRRLTQFREFWSNLWVRFQIRRLGIPAMGGGAETLVKCDRCQTDYDAGDADAAAKHSGNKCEEKRSVDAGGVKALLDEVRELAATRKRGGEESE